MLFKNERLSLVRQQTGKLDLSRWDRSIKQLSLGLHVILSYLCARMSTALDAKLLSQKLRSAVYELQAGDATTAMQGTHRTSF